MSIHRPKRVTYHTNREPSTTIETQKESKVPAWAEAVEGKATADFKAYAINATYAQGDLLRHPKLGDGVVLSVEANKIEVLFESGPRKLAHAM